jgi:hypothetical protein
MVGACPKSAMKKSKGRTAWLISWEGPEAEYNGRCKVVAILPATYGDGNVILSLRVLYHSDCNLTLGEKAVPIVSIYKDPYFRKAYRDRNSEFWYGVYPKHYLSARKVEKLWSEESKHDCFESTLHWTELPKFIPNPKYGSLGSPDAPDSLIQVLPEREAQYTYSARARVEEEIARKAELDRLRNPS